MKTLTERKEIALAINFGKYPVIPIDVSNRDEYGIVGPKVKIDFGGEYMIRADIRVYNDEGTVQIVQGPTCLTASFGYSDFMEILEYANAPVIKANQEIVIATYDSKRGLAYAPRIIKTGAKIDKHCVTPLKLEEYKIL